MTWLQVLEANMVTSLTLSIQFLPLSQYTLHYLQINEVSYSMHY